MNAPGAMIAMLCLGAMAALASAQDLEPRVQTSSAAAPTASGPSEPVTASGSQPPAAGVSGTDASGADRADRADNKAVHTPARNVAPASAPAVKAAAKNTPPNSHATTPKGDRTAERVELGTTQISGNRELPRVMYVVPWRKPELGEFAGRPPNSLLDEALTPVDRDVFRRQNRYYAALQQQANPGQANPAQANPGQAPPAAAGERAAPPSAKDEQ